MTTRALFSSVRAMSGLVSPRAISSERRRPSAVLFLLARSLLALAALALGSKSWIASAQTFTNVTNAAGINHTQFATPPQVWEFTEPRIMSGGAAARDYDNDGYVDLLFTRMDATPMLYRNKGDGSFEVVDPNFSGINLAAGSNGAAWGDINNDGHADLYISTIDQPRNYLYVNNGDGTFSEQAVARQVALSGKGPGYSSAFGDFDNDGYLDLQTASWSDIGGVGTRLLRNQGASNPGYYTDVTLAAGVDQAHTPNYLDVENVTFGFSPRFTDLNHDGHVDIAMASDFNTSRLYWNNGDGTFTDGTVAAGVGQDFNGMGSTVGDYNGDGHLDWFVSAIYDPRGEQLGWGDHGSKLYTNQGDGTFEVTTFDTYWGWGSMFFDYDNSGDLDLTVTNGFDVPDSITTVDNVFVNQPTQLFRNDGGGVFTEVAFAEGIVNFGSGKGILSLDFDNDGRLDLVVVDNEGAPTLYHNDSTSLADWIGIDTVGDISNADGFGAWVTLTEDGVSQVFEVNAGSHFLGQSDKRAHFGLGESDGLVDSISIDWPSGISQTFFDVPANAYYRIDESGGISLAYSPVPEPSSLVLASMAALAVGWLGCRKARASRMN